MQAIRLRPLSRQDSLAELTTMLHRAFARLGRMGLACSCVDQSVATTRRRVGLGACFVAECDGRIVGTLTLHRHERDSDSDVYRSRRVASLHQFAVDPEFQGRGVGRQLLELAEAWVARHGYRELALDTPETAGHLIAFYRHLGFRLAEVTRFAGRDYTSAVLCKAVLSAPAAEFRRCASSPMSRIAARYLHRLPSLGALQGASRAIRGISQLPRLSAAGA